jgi:hypothetical protein
MSHVVSRCRYPGPHRQGSPVVEGRKQPRCPLSRGLFWESDLATSILTVARQRDGRLDISDEPVRFSVFRTASRR